MRSNVYRALHSSTGCRAPHSSAMG